MKTVENIIVCAGSDADTQLVSFAEEQLQIGAVGKLPDNSEGRLVLRIDAEGLSLTEGGLVLKADFSGMIRRLTPHNLNREILVKASRFKNAAGTLTAADATAGLGEDSLLLAAAGFEVQMYERNPVIALLLYDALRRAEKNPDLAPVTEKMRLCIGDSAGMLPELEFSPDLVLLDPMFPQRKKSGLIKKKFQLLQQLEEPCRDEKQLLDAAFSCSPRKIVIKRPMKGPYLAEYQPDYMLKGNSIRYDCIVCAGKR